MKTPKRPLPIRVRLTLSLILLVLTFFLSWWSTGWAWPTRELAYRALETANGFGPGEIVAQGEVTFEEGYSNRYLRRPSAWMVGRFGGSFAAAVLEQAPGPLWREHDIRYYGFQVLTPTEEVRRPSAWMVGRFGGSFAAAVLEQAPGPLWREHDIRYYGFQVLTPTEEVPLTAAELAQADAAPYLFDGQWVDRDTEYLWAICALDPAIVRVEITMNYTYRLAVGEGYSDSMESDPVTAQAQPVAEGVWLARVRLPNRVEITMNYTYRLAVGEGYSDSMESDPVTAQAQPVAEGVWLARVRLPNPLEGRAGGYSANHTLRGYDADGKLIYDSGLS